MDGCAGASGTARSEPEDMRENALVHIKRAYEACSRRLSPFSCLHQFHNFRNNSFGFAFPPLCNRRWDGGRGPLKGSI